MCIFLISSLPSSPPFLSVCHKELLYQINTSTSHHQACSHRRIQQGWENWNWGLASYSWIKIYCWCGQGWCFGAGSCREVLFPLNMCEWYLSKILKTKTSRLKERGRKKKVTDKANFYILGFLLPASWLCTFSSICVPHVKNWRGGLPDLLCFERILSPPRFKLCWRNVCSRVG